jgi:hypothetical protein
LLGGLAGGVCPGVGWVAAGVGVLFEFCIVDASIFVAIVCVFVCDKL